MDWTALGEALWSARGEILLGLYWIANIIVGATDTKDDDRFFAKWSKKILGFISFVTPRNAPGSVKLPLTPPKKASKP